MITSIIKSAFAIFSIVALVSLGADGATLSAVYSSALLICCYIDERTKDKKGGK